MNQLDEITARHAEMVWRQEFGYDFWDSNGEIAHKDRAYLLAEVKRLNELCSALSAPVTDEEVLKLAKMLAPAWWSDLNPDGQHTLNNYPDQHKKYREASIITAGELLTAFLKDRMS